MTRYRFLRLMIGLVLAATLVAPAHSRAAATAPVRLRIGVTTDGIVQVTGADLAAAGVDLAQVDPGTFSMTSLGAPVAISVTGGAGGVFRPDDRILFFGQRFRGTQMEEKYTDERVYWLEIGGAPGPRIAALDAAPAGDLTPPADVATTRHAEENVWWWALHCLCLDTQDTWFWGRLQPVGPGQIVTATLSYTVPDPAPGYPAVFRLEEIGRAYGGPRPNHRTTAAVNGLPVIDQTWSDKQRIVFTGALPAGTLVSGVNRVDVGARTMPGNAADWVYANYWEVDYRRLFRAWQGQFDFRAEETGLHEYLVAGWNTAQVAIWDISNPDQPRALAGAAVSPAGTQQNVRFRVNDVAGARYWLQEDAAFPRPASIRVRPPTGLRDVPAGADTVIVTPAEFLPAAQRLAAWHEAHGRRVLIADPRDVYDEFNDGIFHPVAVQQMLIWGAAHWPGPAPAYLTLVGDGHFNFKRYNPDVYGMAPNPLPPFLAWADPWQGEVAADGLYGDLNGDSVPEVAVGRLSVNTLAEANVVVDKVITYDETLRSRPWQRQALFVADNPDSAGDFHRLSDEIIAGYLPADLAVTRAYLPGSVTVPATPEQIAATRKIISDTLQAGVWMVQYTGHGASDGWASERIFTAADVPGLVNGDRLPVEMVFNCLDGYFMHPDPTDQGLAEVLQRRPGGGVVAAISPSGLGLTQDQHSFRKILMTNLFKNGVRDLGTALARTKRQFYDAYGPNYLIETMILFGDPAMQLPQTIAYRTYLPSIVR